jgi:serine protease
VDGGKLLPPASADFLLRTSVNPPKAQWQKGIPNKPDTHVPGVLDAVAGHANFVAGVVAQHAFQPELQIWHHSSAYKGDDIPTEASVCRSIYMSQVKTVIANGKPAGRPTPTPVINCGLAETVFQDVPSDVWNKLFARIENNLAVDLTQDLIFTAPAGNEGFVSATEATRPHFPAALDLEITNVLNSKKPYAVRFQVIGVASLNPAMPTTASGFSDYGTATHPWVLASAIGEKVVSTFLQVDMETQQDPSAGKQDFTSNYALWNGTSFAAPKIAGEVAARIAAGNGSVSANAAWSAFKTAFGTASTNGLGTMFDL